MSKARPVVPAHGKQRQEVSQLQDKLGSIERICLKTIKQQSYFWEAQALTSCMSPDLVPLVPHEDNKSCFPCQGCYRAPQCCRYTGETLWMITPFLKCEHQGSWNAYFRFLFIILIFIPNLHVYQLGFHWAARHRKLKLRGLNWKNTYCCQIIKKKKNLKVERWLSR